jgi:ABC-type transport system involved in multi-copper enzyme maturation permease subunit
MTAPGSKDKSWPPPVLNWLTVIPLIFRASLTEMLRRRVFVFMAMICAIPVVLTLFWRVWGVDHLTAVVFFTNLVSSFYLQLLVYVVGLAFGIPTVHAEVQARTLTYLFTRPIRKADIYTGRLLAVQLTAGGLLAASLVVCFAIMVVGNSAALSLEFVKVYVNHVLIVLVATICITAVCAIWGTAFHRPVVWGLLWAFGWESIVSKFPGKLQNYTINFHIRNLLLDEADVQSSLMDAFRMLLTQEAAISPWVSGVALTAFLVLAVAAGGVIFARREYVIG